MSDAPDRPEGNDLAALAAYYNATHDVSEFDGGEVVLACERCGHPVPTGRPAGATRRRFEAVVKGLVDDGHMTAAGRRQLLRVLDAEGLV